MTTPAASIIDLYQRHAHRFDAERGRSLVEKGWLDRFLALLPAGGRVLDIGCGMGEPVARYLVGCGRLVTGVDAAPAMIDLARSRMPEQEWRVADMRTLDLGCTFDGLLAWDSFFHLSPDDQRRMLGVFRRHAAPGAALMFTSGPDQGEAIGRFQGEPLYHASLAAAEYRSLLDGHGFDVVAHRVEDPDCGGHTVWLARLR